MKGSATVFVVLCLGACGDHYGSREGGQRVDLEPPPDSLAPVAVEPGCAGIFLDAPLIEAAWALAGYRLDSCQSGVTHEVKQPYDDCEPMGWTLAQCELRPGRQFCQNGYWTTLCSFDENCPSGMRCAWAEGVGAVPPGEYGWCAKTCSGSGAPDDCVRCDLECDEQMGVCRDKVPPIPEHGF